MEFKGHISGKEGATPINTWNRFNEVKNKEGEVTGYMMHTFLDQSGLKINGKPEKAAQVEMSPRLNGGSEKTNQATGDKYMDRTGGMYIHKSQFDHLVENGVKMIQDGSSYYAAISGTMKNYGKAGWNLDLETATASTYPPSTRVTKPETAAAKFQDCAHKPAEARAVLKEHMAEDDKALDVQVAEKQAEVPVKAADVAVEAPAPAEPVAEAEELAF